MPAANDVIGNRGQVTVITNISDNYALIPIYIGFDVLVRNQFHYADYSALIFCDEHLILIVFYSVGRIRLVGNNCYE